MKYIIPRSVLLALLFPVLSFAQTTGLQITNIGPTTDFKVGKEYTIGITGAVGSVFMDVTMKGIGDEVHFNKRYKCTSTSCAFTIPYNTRYLAKLSWHDLVVNVCDTRGCVSKSARVVPGDSLFTAKIISVGGREPKVGDLSKEPTVPVGAEIKIEVTPTSALKNLPEYKNGSVYIALYKYAEDREFYFNTRRILSRVYVGQKALNGSGTIEITIPASITKDLDVSKDYGEKYLTGRPYTPHPYMVSVGLANYCYMLDEAARDLSAATYGNYSNGVTSNGCETEITKMRLRPQISKEYKLNDSNLSVRVLNLFLWELGYDVSLSKTDTAFGIVPFFKNESNLFDEKTLVALKSFQRDYGLPDSGRTDSLTREKINTLLIDESPNKERVTSNVKKVLSDGKIVFTLLKLPTTKYMKFGMRCDMEQTSFKDSKGREYCNQEVLLNDLPNTIELTTKSINGSDVSPVLSISSDGKTWKSVGGEKIRLSLLEIMIPNGGETFKAGEQVEVRWISDISGITTATITLVDASGATVSTLGTPQFASGFASGMTYVKLPTTPGAYKIKITAGTQSDVSDSVFNVKAETTPVAVPSIKIISPTANDIYVQGQPITVRWKSENLPANSNIRILLRPPYYNPNLPLERVSYVFNTNTTSSPDSTFIIPGKYTLQLPSQAFNQSAAGGYRVALSISETPLSEWDCPNVECPNFTGTFQVYPQILDSITLRNYSVQTRSGPSGSPYPIINTPDTKALIDFLTSRGYTSTPFMASDGLQAVSNAFAISAPKDQDSALRQYQRKSGIAGEDGWVGPKTRAFINKEIEKASTAKVTPFIRLTTPNGGEKFTAGERIPVKWTSYGENISQVDISLTQANGTLLDQLTTSTVKDASFKDGLAYVVIPKAGTYKIRIAGGTLADISDATFTVSTVTPPTENRFLPEVSVSKTSVTSGDTVRYDISTHTSNRMELLLKCPTGVTAINQTNNSNICTTPYIYPTNNNGVRLSTAILVKFTNTGSGTLTVEPILKSYKDNVSTSAVVTSANKVSVQSAPVVTPTIALVSPNGGETYTAGDQIVIKWNTTGTTVSDRVKIALNNYSLSPTAITEVSATDGSYTWTTPSNAGKDGIYKKIQVSLGGTTVTDESNNWFIINPTPVVTPPVVTPPVVTPPTTPVVNTPQARSDSPLQLTTVNGVNFYESFGGPIPEITSISQRSAKQGDTITISGKNFSTTENNMIFIDTLAGGVWQVDAKATDNGTKLIFKVGNWQVDQYYVYVTNSNGQSNFKGLKITSISSASLFWALWNLIF